MDKRQIKGRVGVRGEYYQDVGGQWWTINPQVGWVVVPMTSRALQAAISRG